MKEGNCIFGILLVVAMTLGAMLALSNKVDEMKEIAIQQECAKYAPDTGEFTWIAKEDR